MQRVIDIPARLIGDFNRLNIQLIGHYTMECEDPAHSSLWANVGNDSMLELMVNPLPLDNSLAFLPEPFFDRRDSRALKLPIVFATQPDAAQLEAAGTLSSWFGALAGFRGAFFPASSRAASTHRQCRSAGAGQRGGAWREPAPGQRSP